MLVFASLILDIKSMDLKNNNNNNNNLNVSSICCVHLKRRRKLPEDLDAMSFSKLYVVMHCFVSFSK